jgi:hypothetical protein
MVKGIVDSLGWLGRGEATGLAGWVVTVAAEGGGTLGPLTVGAALGTAPGPAQAIIVPRSRIP